MASMPTPDPILSAAVRAFLDAPHVASVATVDPDGARARPSSGTASSPTAGSCSTAARRAAGAEPHAATRASRSPSSTRADGYRWLGLTGDRRGGRRRRRARPRRHRRARPPLPPRGPERVARSPRSAASRGSRSSSGSPASTTTWRTDPWPTSKIGFLLWPQTDSWPAIRDAAVRAEQAGASSLWTWDHLNSIVGPWEGPILEGWSILVGLGAGHRAAHAGPDGRRQHVPQPGARRRSSRRRSTTSPAGARSSASAGPGSSASTRRSGSTSEPGSASGWTAWTSR